MTIPKVMAGGGEMPHIPMAYQHQSEYAPDSFRSPVSAPLRKLTVDLIKTYRKINEVRLCCEMECSTMVWNSAICCYAKCAEWPQQSVE